MAISFVVYGHLNQSPQKITRGYLSPTSVPALTVKKLAAQGKESEEKIGIRFFGVEYVRWMLVRQSYC
jgi:hypothetical protein